MEEACEIKEEGDRVGGKDGIGAGLMGLSEKKGGDGGGEQG